jgi:putative endonuclease
MIIRHYVYIVRCADRSLYTGYAKDPKARVRVHNCGRGARYTAGRRPVRLVYSEVFETVGDALRREHQLKRLTKEKKEALIASSRKARARRPAGWRRRRR